MPDFSVLGQTRARRAFAQQPHFLPTSAWRRILGNLSHDPKLTLVHTRDEAVRQIVLSNNGLRTSLSAYKEFDGALVRRADDVRRRADGLSQRGGSRYRRHFSPNCASASQKRRAIFPTLSGLKTKVVAAASIGHRHRRSSWGSSKTTVKILNEKWSSRASSSKIRPMTYRNSSHRTSGGPGAHRPRHRIPGSRSRLKRHSSAPDFMGHRLILSGFTA